MSLIEELKWRGMLQDIMPGTEEQLNKEATTAYIGFDPTAESLHIGSLVPILLLYHLQQAGHKPIALVGGATGMVGDPSGKSEERNLLNEETLQKNIAGVRSQLEKYLDFNPARENAAEIVNNYDWFKGLGFIDFLRDVGKHITVNYMMSKDSVKKRIEGETGISYTEFAYQLMQGYDFYWLYTHKNCKLQMGGSDQWGNITTGTELIRRKAGGEGFAFTCPLITKADGGKFGKTEKGNVWLDSEKTTPFQFYQFWLNVEDAKAVEYLKIYSFRSHAEIEAIAAEFAANPAARAAQKALAEELTTLIHGTNALAQAKAASEALFGRGELTSLDAETLRGVCATIPNVTLASGAALPDLATALVELKLVDSKNRARQEIAAGGVYINNIKVEKPEGALSEASFIHGCALIRKGKKSLGALVRA